MNDIIYKVADTIVHSKDTDVSMNVYDWDWICGVGMYGLTRVWRKTSNDKYRDFILNWTEKMIGDAYKNKTINSTCPLMTVLEVYKEIKCEKYLTVCIDIADWLIKDATKSVDGAFEHTCIQEGGIVFHDQAWADTLFMSCIFLSQMYQLTGNAQYKDTAVTQLVLHHKLLKDKETGLFFHGWDGSVKSHLSGALWGRANAWIVASTVEILENAGEFAQRELILSSLFEQLDSLVNYQRENGMFGTVINLDKAYDETSAGAGIGYGVLRGINSGIISEKYREMAEKALKAVIERIDENGFVLEVSIGTPIMPTLEEYYEYIWKAPTLYGQALTLLMLCEI